MVSLNSLVSTSEAAIKVVLLPVVLIVEIVHYGRQYRGLDFPHLGGRVLFPEDLVKSSETPAEGGVEVVFDIVIGPE